MMTAAAPITLSEASVRTASPKYSPMNTGAVSGGIAVLLRAEGFAAFATALALYGYAGFSWPLFALLFLAPDLAMVAYVAGPRFGAFGYNLVHTYAVAVAITLAGFFGGMPAAIGGGLILIAHIGFDRALGFGLKYSTGFSDTHLHRVSRG